MKRITVLAFLTAALISMGSACARAQAPVFKVPFDFTVRNFSDFRGELSGQLLTRLRAQS